MWDRGDDEKGNETYAGKKYLVLFVVWPFCPYLGIGSCDVLRVEGRCLAGGGCTKPLLARSPGNMEVVSRRPMPPENVSFPVVPSAVRAHCSFAGTIPDNQP